MKVVIFGGAGFIGEHYRIFLKEKNVMVISVDIKQSDNAVISDVRKKIEINEAFSSSDIIINLAAIHRTPGHPDFEYFETNIKGAEFVCEFANRTGIKNILFTSSIAPYGASEEHKTEETLPTPNTPYGISKLTAEYIHREWSANDLGKRLMILRPGVVFGKGENGNFTRLNAAISKGLFFYPGRKDTKKAAIYVKDLVKISWDLFHKQTNQVELFNFAYEPSYSIEDIVKVVSSVTGKKTPRLLVNGRLLLFVASILKFLGLGKLGIHPARVKKLMTSTNISGKKLKSAIGNYGYTLKEAIQDWYYDCEKQNLR
ncbi:MAG: NAD-dependent epimerase/dehydratase family protein [Reichenbachiella sp.]